MTGKTSGVSSNNAPPVEHPEDNFGNRYDTVRDQLSSMDERRTQWEGKRYELTQRMADLHDELRKPRSFLMHNHRKLKTELASTSKLYAQLAAEADGSKELEGLGAQIDGMLQELQTHLQAAKAMDGKSEPDEGNDSDDNKAKSVQADKSGGREQDDRLAQMERDRQEMPRDSKEYAQVSHEIAKLKSRQP